jgi:hypothetical protein
MHYRPVALCCRRLDALYPVHHNHCCAVCAEGHLR